MSCAFNPPIIVTFDPDFTIIDFYKDWLRDLLLSFESLDRETKKKKSYEFYTHILTHSTIHRDPLWLRIDSKILEYFHQKGELRFKTSIRYVKKTHENKYTLKINTRYGDISHRFSSIRECRETTGLDFRKDLRRILY